MARGCARIDSRPDTAKIGSADRLEVHHAPVACSYWGTKNVSTRPGSKAEKLNASICFPLFTQQRTFLRTAALRQKRPLVPGSRLCASARSISQLLPQSP